MAETGLTYSFCNGQCMTVIEAGLYPSLRESEFCTEKQSEVEFLCFNVLNLNGACRDASVTARISASLSALGISTCPALIWTHNHARSGS
jgi:hypothetical protein